MPVDLLQPDHVGPGLLDQGGDPLEIEDAVDPGAVVDVVRHDGQRPARTTRVGLSRGNGGDHHQQSGENGQQFTHDHILPENRRHPRDERVSPV